jgi:hypothetical protein
MAVLAKGWPVWGRSQFQPKAKKRGPFICSCLIVTDRSPLFDRLNVSLRHEYRGLLLYRFRSAKQLKMLKLVTEMRQIK